MGEEAGESRNTREWNGGRAARCRSEMEAGKERVASRVSVGRHAHL
jgi:hypothetical protein